MNQDINELCHSSNVRNLGKPLAQLKYKSIETSIFKIESRIRNDNLAGTIGEGEITCQF